jgi:aminoglycoside phosphotransferase (APT) family kinase protein
MSANLRNELAEPAQPTEPSQFADQPAGSGPEVYQRSRAHGSKEAVVAVERLMGTRVATIDRDTVGASHAVYLLTLTDGRPCVARFSTDPDHNLARELWATEHCRLAGLPAPRLLAADLAPADGSPPVAIHERLLGVPGHQATLTPAERTAILEQMGRLAAQIHHIRIPGVGPIAPHGDGYAGTAASWATHAQLALNRRLADLPAGTLPANMIAAIRQHFAASRPLFDAAVPPESPTSSLVHADFRLKNALVHRDDAGVPYVSAILDYEMVMAGDGAVDLAWLIYEDGHPASTNLSSQAEGQSEHYDQLGSHRNPDAAAILRGYGASSDDTALYRRLLLYQVHCALGHLWWEVGFNDRVGIAAVLDRIQSFLSALDRF